MKPLPLPLGIHRLTFRSQGRLPRLSGSAWRGAFGHALRRTVCVTRLPSCRGCPLAGTCPYPYLFDTPTAVARFSSAPHPYILFPEPPAEGDEVHLRLTLVGEKAEGFLPYLLHALQKAGERGLSRHRIPFTLTAMETWDGVGWREAWSPGKDLIGMPGISPVPPAPPRGLTIHLDTPLRLKREGRLVSPEDFAFKDLAWGLVRRATLLMRIHGRGVPNIDLEGLKRAAQQVTIEGGTLRWREWIRYSSRQRTSMKMGGLVGSFACRGAVITLWPWLWLGQWIHVGKGTTMGLGRYLLVSRPASLPGKMEAPGAGYPHRLDKDMEMP